jgi:putative transposase
VHLIGLVLKLSKIDEISVVRHRPIPEGFALEQATILRKADGWYVSLNLEDSTVPEPLPMDEIKTAVGIDVGLEKFLVISDG